MEKYQELEQLRFRAPNGKLDPFAGRECGDCNICCVSTSIDAPEMQKRSGAPCRNLCDAGCAIHASRPPICQAFFCGWRQLPFLDDDWRPDRSGVMLKLFVTGGVTGLSILLHDDPERTVRRPWFLSFVMAGLKGSVPLWLALDGPPGHEGAQMILNTQEMMDALADSKGAQARVKDILQGIVATLRRFAFAPTQFVHHGNDASGP